MSLFIVVASATSTNGAPRLNNAAPRLNNAPWINLPSQLRIMKTYVAPSDVLDPSTLILMNPPCGRLHDI